MRPNRGTRLGGRPMVRRAVFAAFLLLLLSTASVAASSKTVSIYNYGFKPATTTIHIGMGAAFKNTTSATLHSTTSDLLNLWSDDVQPGTTTTVSFWHAGSFPFHCRIHPFMMGTIKVKPTVSPLSGSTSTTFKISVSAIALTSGFKEDIQKRKNGGTWQLWMSTSA